MSEQSEGNVVNMYAQLDSQEMPIPKNLSDYWQDPSSSFLIPGDLPNLHPCLLQSLSAYQQQQLHATALSARHTDLIGYLNHTALDPQEIRTSTTLHMLCSFQAQPLTLSFSLLYSRTQPSSAGLGADILFTQAARTGFPRRLTVNIVTCNIV